MRKLLFGLIASWILLAGGTAQAAGYVNAVNKSTYEGWACNPSTPGYSGWIHLWRDDGKFVGAIHANIQREPAVGSICGDVGIHGFSGTVSIPADYLDNAWHTVRAYFINDDGSSFELQNSAQALFDGGPQPYVFNRQNSGACTFPPAFDAIPGWLQTARDLSSWAYCPQGGYGLAREYVYAGDPAAPVGSELEICATPVTLSKIPAGWQVISVAPGGCVKDYTTVAIPPNKPNFYDVTYHERLKIRKVN